MFSAILPSLLPLLWLPPTAALGPPVYTQYSSASDTSLSLRVAIVNSCRDGLGTACPFLFRELPGLDGSADGVSLMPAATDGFFICAEGNDTDRLVAVRPALSAAQCTFRRVAGLSNPALVSFEQRGRYVGYASAYAYDCASWFDGRMGWTVGLAYRPTDATLATWVASASPPVNMYIQDTNSWLGSCAPESVFYNPYVGDIAWDAVQALDNDSATAISLRLHSSSSASPLYLGVDAAGEQQLSNSSAQSVALRVWDCAGHASACTWTVAQSALSGDFWLTHTASGWTVVRETAPNGLACNPQNAGRALLSRSSTGETLGFWRSNYNIPSKPAVIAVAAASSSSSSRASSLMTDTSGEGQSPCATKMSCWSCIAADGSCGWCSETALCTRRSETNCSPTMWLHDTCTASRAGGGVTASLVVPLVGVSGGVVVVGLVTALAVLLIRSGRQRGRGTSKAAEHNKPVEGPSVTFVSAAPGSDDFSALFTRGAADTAAGSSDVSSVGGWQLALGLSVGTGQSASPVYAEPAAAFRAPPQLLGVASSEQFQLASYTAGTCEELSSLRAAYTQYNSAGDTSLSLRVVVNDSCEDGLVYSDAQFLFRELPGLDGSADGVSLMPAATDGFFLCAEGNDTDRLVAVRPAVSASLCTFRKVAGLSNPALVSFEQRGRYVGYARGYDYACASWFSGMMGWTAGLVERPADARLATWVATHSSVVSVYVQDTYSWLCELSGVAVFNDTDRDSVRCQWDVVAALGTDDSPSSAVSLRLRNTSLFLGVAEHESPDDNDSAALPLRVHSCAGTERLCVWTANISPRLGNFMLTHVASGLGWS
eukprot:m51a1_g10303 hypothetical protein (827) ;mRNA; r:66500-69939